MKRIGLGTALCAFLLSTTAMAADLNVAPVYRPIVAPFTWSGIYLGINGGYGYATGNAAATVVTPFFVGSSVSQGDNGKVSGPLFGGQIGFNYQAGPVVFGAEVDGQWASQSETTLGLCGAGCTTSEVVKVKGFATARARIGVAIDQIMVYATGGAALSWFSDNVTATAGATTVDIVSISASKAGWVAGVGIEGAISRNWSLRGEYLYISTDGITGTGNLPAGLGTVAVNANVHNNVARAALNYRFGP